MSRYQHELLGLGLGREGHAGSSRCFELDEAQPCYQLDAYPLGVLFNLFKPQFSYL